MANDSVFEMTIDMDMFDLGKMKNSSVPLGNIAEKAAKQIKKQIRQKRSWTGQWYKGLSAKTIKDKRREGARDINTPLIRTGLMFDSIQARKGVGNTYYVGVVATGSPRRDLLAMIHQYEGVNKHTRITRKFFGLSMKFHKDATAYMSRWVKSQLRTVKKRKVRIK